jgi:Meiotically up-regulated gene 113
MNPDKFLDKTFTYKIHPKDHDVIKDYFAKKQGWVYIANSPNYELADNDSKNIRMLKIGRSGKNPFERAKSLSSSGVAYDYDIIFSLPFFNQFIAEKNVHNRLKKLRGPKEFFRVSQDDAIKAVQDEYNNERNLLSRFFDVNLLDDDINLVEYAIKK